MADRGVRNVSNYNPQEIKDFLIANKIKPAVAQCLYDEGFDGPMFVSFNREDYEELGLLKKTDIIFLCKLKNRDEGLQSLGDFLQLLPHHSSSAVLPPLPDTNLTVSDLESRLDVNKAIYVTPRLFGQAATEIRYPENAFLPQEGGGSALDDPVREFKLLDMKGDTEEKLTLAFVKRAGKFIIGCMNKRCNGTMYFGVGDCHASKYEHGQIVGLQLKPNQREMFQTMMTNYFTGKEPVYLKGVEDELKQAIQSCVSSLYFIPVTGTRSFVMEFDVEPATSICKPPDIFYTYFQGKDTMSKTKGGGRKKIQKDRKRMYFLREETSTNEYSEKSELSELKEKVEMAVKKREALELERQIGSPLVKDSLERLICQNRSSNMLDDEETSYILLNTLDMSRQKLENFSWITKINWSVIIDVSSSPVQSGIILLYEKEPPKLFASRLTELCQKDISVEKFLENTGIGQHQLLIQSETTGDEWLDKDFRGIDELIFKAYEKSRFDPSQRIVVITLVDRNCDLSRTLEIVSCLRRRILAPDQFAILADCESALHKFQRQVDSRNKMLGSVSRNQMQRLPFQDLQNFMMSKIKSNVSEGFKVVTGSGILADLSEIFIDKHKKAGLEILAANYGEQDMTFQENETFCSEGIEMIKKFLRGFPPHWGVFYFANLSVRTSKHVPPGVVERHEILEKICNDIDRRIEEIGKCVYRKRIVHQPGSGATTISRHVLWKKRKKMRCVSMDGLNFVKGIEPDDLKLKAVAHKLLDIRAEKEDPEMVKEETAERGRCATVLVLLDNASDLMGKILTKHIELAVEHRQIKFKRTMFVVLYLVSSFDLEGLDQEYVFSNFESIVPLETMKIEQKLSDEEAKAFQMRLYSFQHDKRYDQYDLKPEHMLSFVIMAERFKEDSIYVKNVVQNSIINMEKLYPLELKLLLYLSVLKYYANAKLPMATCLQVSLSGIYSYTKGWAAMSNQSRMFLRKSRVDDPSVSGDCYMLEVIHGPVAFHLKNIIMTQMGTKLSQIVKEMMESANILQIRFMNDFLHSTFRTLLVRRTTKSDLDIEQSEKEKFSRLIHEVIKTESRESALSLLETGFDRLENNYKAAVAQTLARFQYIDQKKLSQDKLNKAKQWAFKGKELKPKLFTMHDTIGQVYRREASMCIDKHKSIQTYSMADCIGILKAANSAAKAFLDAEHCFNMSRNKNHEISREDMYTECESATNNPQMFAEIAMNLEVVKHILGTTEMANKDKKKQFLEILRQESKQDLRTLFPSVTDWQVFLNYVKNLYRRSHECLQVVTKKLGYVNMSDENLDKKQWISTLEKRVKEMDDIFGFERERWQRQVKENNCDWSLRNLRRFLAMRMSNSFGWLALSKTCCSEDQLQFMREVLLKMEQLHETRQPRDIGLVACDKVSYLNVAFAKVHGRHEGANLDLSRVRKYSRELVEDNVDDPEPYFFFLMLFWPSEYEDTNLDLLRRSIKKLSEFEETLTNPRDSMRYGFRSKTFPIFFLSDGKGYDKVVSAQNVRRFQMANLAITIRGQLDVNKDVDIMLKSTQSRKALKIKAANHYHRGSLAKSVIFYVGFTFAGPKAYYIEEVE